jgi:hypothetical protein
LSGLNFATTNPAASGFTKIFDEQWTSAATIDTANTRAPGYNWYIERMLYSTVSNPADLSVSGGVLTITPSSRNGNWSIATAAANTTKTGAVGTVFGRDNHSYYFSAQLSFNAADVNTANGWPAFWAADLEQGLRGVSGYSVTYDQWPGQIAGYEHFIEDDFFEYLSASAGGANSYAASIHDWFGPSGKYSNVQNNSGGSSLFGNQIVKLSNTTDWTVFHTVSQLYVPGTAANGYLGYVVNYFDGIPQTKIMWRNSTYSPPPSGLNVFNILDQRQIYLILGSGNGQALRVGPVQVWVK